MDERTREAQKWLDRRYQKFRNGRYYAHEPVYGFDSEFSEPNSIIRLARTYSLLKLLAELEFSSALDVGGGEGYTTSLIREFFGVDVLNSDLSAQAGLRARDLFNIQSVATDASQVALQDNSYDLVICSEVIEHLSRPVEVMSELLRISKKYVLLTTEEFCPLGKFERFLRLCTLDMSYPHAERNYFTTSDFRTIYGEEISLFSQFRNFNGYAIPFFMDHHLTSEQVERALELLTSSNNIDTGHHGVMVLVEKESVGKFRGRVNLQPLELERKKKVLNHLLKPEIKTSQEKSKMLELDQFIASKLVCLLCSGSLSPEWEQLDCVNCKHRYDVQQGVPLLFLSEVTPESLAVRRSQAILRLSQNDPKVARRIESLIKTYSGKRPLIRYPVLRRFARILLHMLIFILRPESVSAKIYRVYCRIRNIAPAEYDLLAELLLR